MSIYGLGSELDPFIVEAFERIGKNPDTINVVQAQSAIRSINLELLSWQGKGLNLFTVEKNMVALKPFQGSYPVPSNVIKILECTMTYPQRYNKLSNGEPAGDASWSSIDPVLANALFTDQGVAEGVALQGNGFISYTFSPILATTAYPSIQYVGLDCYADTLQPNSFSVTGHSNPGEGIPSFSNYFENVMLTKGLNWFVLNNTRNAAMWRLNCWSESSAYMPLSGIYYSIDFNPNANIQNISSYYNSMTMGPIGRQDYILYPNRNISGRPSQYYFDYKVEPQIFILQTPNPNLFTTTNGAKSTPTLFYTSENYINSYDELKNLNTIPSKFLDALIAGLSFRLAEKYNPQLMDHFDRQRKEAYELASKTDSENVQIQLNLNVSSMQ